jgi:type I restriction enzyme S subunit
MSFPRYQSYKNSSVEWLGEVPDHWKEKPLKTVTSINDEVLSESVSTDHEIEYVDISSVSLVNGIERTENMIFGDAPSRARRITRDGDVLVSTVRTYLKAIAPVISPPSNLVASTGFAVVRPQHGIHPGYLKYSLQEEHFIQQVISRSTGVSYPAINASDIARIPLSLPKQSEQLAIATFLDHETAKIDALIAEQQRLIKLLQEKRQAVISQAVTKGLNPDAPMKDSGVEWLGQVPEHWTVSAVGHRYEVRLGKMLDEKRVTGEHLGYYLRNTDVQWESINIEELPEMDFEPSEHDRYSLREGDLLVCEGGEVGRSAIWQSQLTCCFYQKALHRLRAYNQRSDDCRFQLYVMRMACSVGVFEASSGKATINHLPAESFRRYRFAYPPLDEQIVIAEHLSQVCSQLNELEAEANSLVSRLQERRSALISAAVTGQIDVRGLVSEAGAA